MKLKRNRRAKKKNARRASEENLHLGAFKSPSRESVLGMLLFKGDILPESGKVYVFPNQRITIGRERTRDICVRDNIYVSRLQACIHSDDSDVYLEDLGASGTYVNDIAAATGGDRFKLTPGDVIMMGGHTTIRFQAPE